MKSKEQGKIKKQIEICIYCGRSHENKLKLEGRMELKRTKLIIYLPIQSFKILIYVPIYLPLCCV